MRPTIRIKPRAGLRVLYPGTTQALPAEGGSVPASSYWLRRLRDGDVEKVVEAASNPKPRRNSGEEG